MLMTTLSKTVAQQLDRWVLYAMNQRVPDSFEGSHQDAPPFEEVLAQTAVDTRKTDEYQLSAPGERTVWLRTATDDLFCRVRVQLAVDPEAPLLLYHPGFNEVPYTSSWGRLFRRPASFPAHTVCIQAPFHDNMFDPMSRGFASLRNVYQMFAGSLRIMELLQSHFESQGASYTAVAGISWGGITSLLYEGLFQRTRAVIPMLASPNLARVMWDIAALWGRPMPMPLAQLEELLDFTPYYRRCDPKRVFPLLGENDLFFRLEHHADAFPEWSIRTIPAGHITGYWQFNRLRQHILEALDCAASASPEMAGCRES